jgi:TPP-dependent indolepyruvate ferredoxin oxidoreductase alpha subunit
MNTQFGLKTGCDTMTWTPMRKKHECFLNGLNDGLAYTLEARDFENFQAMVNKVLVLENRRAILECKRK